jgi:hypothetical protein
VRTSRCSIFLSLSLSRGFVAETSPGFDWSFFYYRARKSVRGDSNFSLFFLNFHPLSLLSFGLSFLFSLSQSASANALADEFYLSFPIYPHVSGTYRPADSTKTQIQTGNPSHSRNQKVSKINRLVDSKTALCETRERDLQRVYGSTDAMDRRGVVSVTRVLGGLFSAFV